MVLPDAPHGHNYETSPSVHDDANRIVYTFTSREAYAQQRKRNAYSGWNALVDRGANGGIAGNDTRVIEKTDVYIDLCGIDEHTVSNLQIVTAGAVVQDKLKPCLERG